MKIFLRHDERDSVLFFDASLVARVDVLPTENEDWHVVVFLDDGVTEEVIGIFEQSHPAGLYAAYVSGVIYAAEPTGHEDILLYGDGSEETIDPIVVRYGNSTSRFLYWEEAEHRVYAMLKGDGVVVVDISPKSFVL